MKNRLPKSAYKILAIVKPLVYLFYVDHQSFSEKDGDKTFFVEKVEGVNFYLTNLSRIRKKVTLFNLATGNWWYSNEYLLRHKKLIG